MSLINRIVQFSCELYGETCAIPTMITLPAPIFDRLVDEAAEKLRQKPSIVPGSIPEIHVETGCGVVAIRRSVPSPSNPTEKT